MNVDDNDTDNDKDVRAHRALRRSRSAEAVGRRASPATPARRARRAMRSSAASVSSRRPLSHEHPVALGVGRSARGQQRGGGIASLQRTLLASVFSYLSDDELEQKVALVSKDWAALVDEVRDELTLGRLERLSLAGTARSDGAPSGAVDASTSAATQQDESDCNEDKRE